MDRRVKVLFLIIIALHLLLGSISCKETGEGSNNLTVPTSSQRKSEGKETLRSEIILSSTFPSVTLVPKASVQVTSPNATSTPLSTLNGKGGGVIAFQSDRDRQDEIYVMNADGSDQRLLLSNIGALDSAPAWSPDGKQIAFASRKRGRDFEICIVSVGDLNQTISSDAIRCLTDNDFDDLNPTWSPDGGQIAFSSSRNNSSEIFVVNVENANESQLTENNFPDKDPTWSPDGKQFAFASNRDGDFDIMLMNSDGSDLRSLTVNDSNEWSPTWSPDNKQIAFISDRGGEHHLYVMEIDDSETRQLTSSLFPWNDDPAWSPDGLKIAFRSSRNGFVDIFILSISSNSPPNQLTKNSEFDQDRAPTWRP